MAIKTSKYVQRLKIIKEVRELAVATDGLAIPQLVVVGSQSVGKSAVITACTDVPFPQGNGICTKAAIVVNCTHEPALSQNKFEILDVGSAQSSFVEVGRDELAQEISRQQALLMAKDGKAPGDTWIVSEEIKLRVSGPSMMDTILVDLPGLIENAPDDVPEHDLERLKTQIENLVRRYIECPHTLIAVVQRADEDIERVKAIRLARQFDVEARRTVKILNMFDVFTNAATKERAIHSVNDGYQIENGPHALTCKCKDSGLDKSPSDEQSELRSMGVREGRAGISILKLRLERKFEILIDTNLPELISTVRQGLDQSRQSLRSIGVDTESPAIMVRKAIIILEDAKSDLTKRITSAHLTAFAEGVRNTKEKVTLEFVTDGYTLDASMPAELQLAEPFLAALVKVTDLWRPVLESYIDGVCEECQNWAKVHLGQAGQISRRLEEAVLRKFQEIFHQLGLVFKDACLTSLNDEVKYKTVDYQHFCAAKQSYINTDALGVVYRNVLEKFSTSAEANCLEGREAVPVDQMLQAILGVHANFAAEQLDVVASNKRQIHSLAIANFDVSMKNFCDNVLNHTLSLVGPQQHRHQVPRKCETGHNDSVYSSPLAIFDSIMDWVKFGIMPDDEIASFATEDAELVCYRQKLKERLTRLEKCDELLQNLQRSTDCTPIL